jgi:hypothetical protein
MSLRAEPETRNSNPEAGSPTPKAIASDLLTHSLSNSLSLYFIRGYAFHWRRFYHLGFYHLGLRPKCDSVAFSSLFLKIVPSASAAFWELEL